MIAKNYSWLLAALFMLLGVFSAQAQEEPMECLSLDIQHVESDFVPAEQCNYYRNFFTLDNISGEGTINVWRIAAGDDHFILYRYPTIDGAIPTAVAELKFTLAEAGVNYEITYLNQEPLEGYDLELVTEGTLEVENYTVNFDDIVLVDQCKVLLVDDGSFDDYYYEGGQNVDLSQLFYWADCGYVMLLAKDENWGTNSVVVPSDYRISLFSMGNYKYEELDADEELPTLLPGMKNACFECFNLHYYSKPEVTGYTILRGDNTYPTDTICYLTRIDDHYGFLEECQALPEYFGHESTWEILRNDSALKVLGQYGDYMTYVPVIRTNGEDRVKKDGDNTYGGFATKTGVAGLDALVIGEVFDHNSETPIIWKDENGETCTVFKPNIAISALLPDYASMEYEAERISIWLKCDNIRNYYIDDDGMVVNDLDEPRDDCMLFCSFSFDYFWDSDLQEWVTDFTDLMEIYGEPGTDDLCFGATYATAKEGVTFIIRFYYKDVNLMPAKAPSYPDYCVVEKEVEWIPIPDFTSVKEIGSEIEVGKTYYNVQGVASDKPFSGFNIEVTRYGDGSTKSKKVML